MPYFAHFYSKLNPANNLQKYLLQLVEPYNNTLVDDPEQLFNTIQDHATRASFTYKRCTPQRAGANRDFKTKEIESIGAGGLFMLSLYKITGTFDPQTGKVKTPTAIEPTGPAPTVAPTAKPEPEPTNEPTSQPRQAIHKSRTEQVIDRLDYWHKFSPEVQRLLEQGRIWLMYENVIGVVIAEEYGGKFHKAYPE